MLIEKFLVVVNLGRLQQYSMKTLETFCSSVELKLENNQSHLKVCMWYCQVIKLKLLFRINI